MPVLTFTETALARPDATPLIAAFSLSLEAGVTGLVGGNGTGKSSLLAAIAGAHPHAGHIHASTPPRRLAQLAPRQGTRVADLFDAAGFDRLQAALAGAPVDYDLVDWTLEERMAAALAQAGVPVAPARGLSELSGGQQRRAALAAAFFDAPGIVLLDEPTNDLDAEGRALVAELLATHRGIALVASHDRALLERVDRIIELAPGGVHLFGGGWSAFAAARAAAELERAGAEVARARRAAQTAEMRAARRARQGRALRDGSQSKMLLDKAREGAEAAGAGQSRLATRQQTTAVARLAAAQAGVVRDRAISFDLPSTGLAAQKLVLRACDLGVGQAGRALLPPLSFELRGPERVRLSGANGSGKSTLLRQIAGRLPPLSGRIERPVDSVYLDQRLSHLGQAGDVLSLARRTLPEMGEQDCRALLARLLFRNREALKPLAGLSGGERLRLGLALTLGRARPPQLVLLDEPTNHLDLAAIAAVERALGEYDGALIFVTHDSAFAAALAPAREIAIASGRVSDRGLA